MIVAGPTLALLLARCASNIAPTTMAAIVQVESGSDPLAIGDNTTRRSYHPPNVVSAQGLANRLLRLGHSLDVGLAQIDNMNFARLGVNTHTVFDPCANLSLGARILSADYALAARRYRDPQVALRHAIGMYNTGLLNDGSRYVGLVLRAAGVHDPRSSISHDAPRRNISRRHLFDKKSVAVGRDHEQSLPELSPIFVAAQQQEP